MNKAALLGLATFIGSVSVYAQEGVVTQSNPYSGIAAAFAIGVAVIGGALGQGKIGAAAMEGIARNPQARKEMFGPLIVSLALVESLVIYALVIAFKLL